MGLFLSHCMRWVIHKTNILFRPLQVQFTGFIAITLIFAFLLGLTETYIWQYFGLLPKQPGTDKAVAIPKLIVNNAFSSFAYLFIWNCIYFIYHYIEKSR